MKNIFVTGATGVLGRQVLQGLIKSNYKVTALSRSQENAASILKQGGHVANGDLFDKDDMVAATRGCHAIFHLATHIPNNPMPNKPSHWKTNDLIRTRGTEALLHAAKENQITCFIQPSVTLLYGNRQGEAVDVTARISEDQPFMLRSALSMERLVQSSGIDNLILRFGNFYSKDSSSTLQMMDSIKSRKWPIIGNGSFYWNYIHVDDAARAILYAFDQFDRLKNNIINFTDFQPIQLKSLIYQLAELTNSKKPFSIPRFLAKIMLGDLYKVISASHQIKKSSIIQDWTPNVANVIEGMKTIFENNNK